MKRRGPAFSPRRLGSTAALAPNDWRSVRAKHSLAGDNRTLLETPRPISDASDAVTHGSIEALQVHWQSDMRDRSNPTSLRAAWLGRRTTKLISGCWKHVHNRQRIDQRGRRSCTAWAALPEKT